jgi:hypothetical protein
MITTSCSGSYQGPYFQFRYNKFLGITIIILSFILYHKFSLSYEQTVCFNFQHHTRIVSYIYFSIFLLFRRNVTSIVQANAQRDTSILSLILWLNMICRLICYENSKSQMPGY